MIKPSIICILIVLLMYKPSQPSYLPVPQELQKSGGCGWTAYYLSSLIKEPYKIVAYRLGNYPEFHVVLETDQGIMDGSGYFSLLHPLRLLPSRVLTRDELYALLHDHSRWNSNFDLNDTCLIPTLSGVGF